MGDIRESLIQRELAQAERIRVDTELARKQLEAVGIDVAIKTMNHAIDRAKDFPSRVFQFFHAVNEESVCSCLEVLGMWHRMDPKCDIEIIFNSNGGEVMPGLALFDYICGLVNSGHKVTTYAIGQAASMAGILLQAGSHRVVGKESYVLIHQVTGRTVGKISDIEDTTTFLKMLQDRVTNIFVSRGNGSMTREMFQARWTREWWLDSTELLQWGFVDEVR